MRVAIVVSSLEAGGTERFSTLLASGLSELDNEVTLVTLTAARRDFYSVPGDIRRIALNGDRTPNSGAIGKVRRDLLSLRRLRVALRSCDADVIVALGWSTNVIVLVASVGLGAPVVISERSDPRGNHIAALWRLGRRLTYPFARRLVVQTSTIADVLHHWVRRQRIRVIPNPALPRALELRAHPGPSPTIVSMGRMTKEKGFDVLLDAFALVHRSIPEARLMLIGDGPLRPLLAEQAERLLIAEWVDFTGQLADPHAAMAEAWCYALPSRLEGFPNALLEAMAMGLPSVATDCQSGPRELLEGKAGLLVPVDDAEALGEALVKVLADAEFAAKLADLSRRRAEDYDLAGIMRRWDAELSSI